MFAVLLLLSACATISMLHIISPRHSLIPEAAKEIIPPPKELGSSIKTGSPPVRLEITRLSVNAPVIAVGLTSDNAMDIDKEDISKTAWYRFGPKPGENGSAVIAGHYGWRDGQGSVFNNLHTLQPGDKILIYDEESLVYTFVVREVRRYNLNADTMEVFRSNDGKAHLNLITCDGSWNQSDQTYSDRLVVFSDIAT